MQLYHITGYRQPNPLPIGTSSEHGTQSTASDSAASNAHIDTSSSTHRVSLMQVIYHPYIN